MSGNNARQPVDRSDIKGDERFVENPQRALFLDQASQCDAPLLALRQIFAGKILAAGQPYLLQRIERIVVGEFLVRKTGSGEQVFQRRQFFLCLLYTSRCV